MKVLHNIICLFLFFLSGCSPLDVEYDLSLDVVSLSENGSRRATAYELSNKLIELPDGLVATYLEYNLEEKRHELVVVKLNSQMEILKKVNLGDARDDHGGAALVVDSRGDIHAFYGAHNNSLKYRHSTDFGRLDQWSSEKEIGNGFTYPSAVITPNDRIFVVVRDGYNVFQKDPWSYDLLSIDGGELVQRKKLLISRRHDQDFVNRYIHYFAQLGISEQGRLTLAFLVHERSSDDPVVPANGVGYGIGLIHSEDNGDSWSNWDSQALSMPLLIEDSTLFLGELDTKSIRYDYRSLSLNYYEGMPLILASKYDFEDYSWSTSLYQLTKDFQREEVIMFDEPLYKSSVSVCGDKFLVISEYLPEQNISVEEGWSNRESRISVIYGDSDSYLISLPEELYIAEDVHWYPSTQKDHNVGGYFMFMVGSEDGSTEVIVSKVNCGAVKN